MILKNEVIVYMIYVSVLDHYISDSNTLLV